MSEKNEKKLKPHEGHALKTRRDFLSQGLVAGGGLIMAPSLYTILTNKVMAETSGLACPPPNLNNPMIPVISIELAGGGNIAGRNVMVGGLGGQTELIDNYISLGLQASVANENPATVANISSELGLRFHRQGGHFRGIMEVFNNNLSAISGGKTNGYVMCTMSSDDTGNNKFVPSHWIVKAGRVGALTQIVGTSASASGTRSKAVDNSIASSSYPVRISGVTSATGLANFELQNFVSGYSTMMSGSTSVAEKILKRIERLSEKQLQSFSQQDLSQQLKDVTNNSYFGSRCQMGGTFAASSLDASQDAVMTQVFPDLNGENGTHASIIKLVLDGYAATGNIELGGYDYHGRDSSDGNNSPENKDLQAGRLIGRILRIAQLKNKPVGIFVYTDGSVSFSNNTFDPVTGRNVPVSDSGQRSSAYFLVFHPTANVTMRNNRNQLGAFKNGGTVNTTASPISNSVRHEVHALIANYLALHGLEAQYDNVVDTDLFPGSGLDNILMFNRVI